MTVIARFVGGPIDGKELELPDAPSHYEVPTLSLTDIYAGDVPGALLPTEAVLYTRDPTPWAMPHSTPTIYVYRSDPT